MEIHVGMVVYNKRFPDTVVGKVVFVNTKTQVAIVETPKGWSALPIYMIGGNNNAR